MSSRKSRNRMRIIRAIVIALIIVMAIASAGYAIGNRIFHPKDDTVYINAGYSSTSEKEIKNVLDRSDDEEEAGPAVDELMEKMDLHDKVSQMFVTTPEALTGISTVVQAGDTTKNALYATPLGGIVYSDKNFEDDDQTETMIDTTQECSLRRTGARLFIGVREKDGSISIGEDASGSSLHVTVCPDGDTSDLDREDYVDEASKEVGNQTRILLASNAAVDSVDESPVPVSETWLSDIVRGDLDYDGVIMTEDLVKMPDSGKSSVGDRAVRAIEAGADMVFVGNDLKSAVSAVESAVDSGQISEKRIDESVRRILELKDEYEMLRPDRRLDDLANKTEEDADTEDEKTEDEDADKKDSTAAQTTDKNDTSSNNKKNSTANDDSSTSGVVDDKTDTDDSKKTGSTGVEGVVDDPDSGDSGNND